jgi:hypothetical protein
MTRVMNMRRHSSLKCLATSSGLQAQSCATVRSNMSLRTLKSRVMMKPMTTTTTTTTLVRIMMMTHLAMQYKGVDNTGSHITQDNANVITVARELHNCYNYEGWEAVGC